MISVLVAALLSAASPSDTVYTVDGGRITGTVLEESPTTGVAIQTADGSIRRIDRSQVSRIEFADGSVSNVRPPAQAAEVPAVAPTPPAAPPPRAPAVEGPIDNVYLAGGGRARGTVMEENAGGVKVRLLDGSIRTYSAQELVRIEYADGTVSTPRAAQPKPADPAPVARAKSTELAPIDNIYFFGGGRVRGTVLEENPKTGVRVRLLDVSIQTYSRDDLLRIEYADGSVSRRVTPPPAPPAQPAVVPVSFPAPPPAPAPAPQPAFVPPPTAKREVKPQAFPLYLSLGVGATFLGGEAERAVPMSSALVTEQAHVSSEIGLRFSPSFALGVYGDVSGGDAPSAVRDQCRVQNVDCTGATGHFGVLVRHTWEPLSTRPKWLSLGTGWEYGGVAIDRRDGGKASELYSYTGREYVRLGAGVDFRSNEVLALGLYASFAVGEYDKYKDPAGITTAVDRATHTTTQVGLRLTLFP